MKISIIGAGRLGGLIGFLIAEKGLASELILVDVNKPLAEGQAMDLKHASFNAKRDVAIHAGDFSSVKGSGIIIITAGKPRTAAMSSRSELLIENAKIIKQIASEIKSHCINAILITTTNPIDAINYVLWKETGFDRSKIIGFGGLLDSARLNAIIAEETNTPIQSISCEVIGEHGENMVPLFSRVKINGKMRAFSDEQKIKVRAALLGTAKEVIEEKGATEYGPASHILRMVESVVNDKKETLLCSCILDGEYGLNGVSLGVPAVIGKNGIKKIAELPIEKQEMDSLKSAAEKMHADLVVL